MEWETLRFIILCNPHSPWRKGSVENLNGRIRRYWPRNIDTSSFSTSDLKLLALKINTTPRKCLDYKTPMEVFFSQLLHFKCELTPIYYSHRIIRSIMQAVKEQKILGLGVDGKSQLRQKGLWFLCSMILC